MKIRWSSHSIRFRITPSELAALQSRKSIEEVLSAPGGSWRASIVPAASTTGLSLSNSHLTVSLSAPDLENLLNPAAEGVYFNTDSEPQLRYFIEKDFPCAHPRASEALEPAGETFAPTPGFEERKRDQ